VTKRYNRVINRAVMDETLKRFFAKGRADLESLELSLNDIEDKLNSKDTVLSSGDVKLQLSERHQPCQNIATKALKLSKTMGAENQPMKRLMDAIAIYQKSTQDDIASLSARMEAINIAKREPDNQITLGARLIFIKAQQIMFGDILKVMDSRGRSTTQPRLKLSFTKRSSALIKLLENCRDLITLANKRNLSRIVITATISFATIVQLDAWSHRTQPGETTIDPDLKGKHPGLETLEDRSETTRNLLAAALKLCDELGNFPELQERVQEMARLYEGPRYETVTIEELQSIKLAMISGHGGIATHSGHWYNCVNGHPVSEYPFIQVLPSRDKSAKYYFCSSLLESAVCQWSRLDVLNVEHLLEVKITGLSRAYPERWRWKDRNHSFDHSTLSSQRYFPNQSSGLPHQLYIFTKWFTESLYLSEILYNYAKLLIPI
jgi:hypothetical protein